MADKFHIFVVELTSTTNITQTIHTGYSLFSTDPTFANLTIDGVAVSLGNWVLLTAQTNAEENGLWNVNQIGNGTDENWILIRLYPADELCKHQLFYTISGDINSGTYYIINNENPITAGATLLSISEAPINVETNNQICADNSTDPATPGYAFIGDKDTGMGWVSQDSIALITGATRALTIDNAQNININAGDFIVSNSASDNFIRVGNGTTGELGYTFQNDTDTGIARVANGAISMRTNNTNTLKTTRTQALVSHQEDEILIITDDMENYVVKPSDILNGLITTDTNNTFLPSPVPWFFDTGVSYVNFFNTVTTLEDDDAIDFTIIYRNQGIGAGTLNLNAGTGGSIVGGSILEPATGGDVTRSQGHFRLRFTDVAANTYVVYRIS